MHLRIVKINDGRSGLISDAVALLVFLGLFAVLVPTFSLIVWSFEVKGEGAANAAADGKPVKCGDVTLPGLLCNGFFNCVCSTAYICALQREVPYHGRLYITENNACFHSSVLLKATKVI